MTEPTSRRTFVADLGAAVIGGCAVAPDGPRASSSADFAHGVASGDPAADGFVVWTRVRPAGPATVTWSVAADRGFRRIAARGTASADPDGDWTVKFEVAALDPGTTYFYRFVHDGTVSPVGRSRTLRAGDVHRLRLAVVSCADHAMGYFNVYDAIARTEGFDAVLHLGDYLYERGPGSLPGGPGEIAERRHLPPHEAVSLADYRTRNAQYKSDPALQALHAAHPAIAVWDDHEISNNVWG